MGGEAFRMLGCSNAHTKKPCGLDDGEAFRMLGRSNEKVSNRHPASGGEAPRTWGRYKMSDEIGGDALIWRGISGFLMLKECNC